MVKDNILVILLTKLLQFYLQKSRKRRMKMKQNWWLRFFKKAKKVKSQIAMI